ncbi:D-glycerate dehydrogenase [Litorilinea aerophila]|uniref:Glyoxylate/hydroxypyruvate reductase B n=1 Tax=Litorilinea aerophila TaxID=1204385 RepID=A0A540VL04_9CHLR|nr:D-glycerate dehydrogenase [Litorilinea aerophila]MCC9075130.1 D-glycerate dehydrogenase [Litorilinea aerophila]GIV78130.1 MAG: D-glycerate dehydrogenase [Litorilinea sp.]
MSKPNVVITRRIPEAGLARVQEVCQVRQWDSDDPIPRETLLEWVRGIDGLYCLLTERIDEELLDAAGSNLRVVSTLSVGYDHIDVAACRRRNIAVGNTPGVLTETTADLAVALLLATARRIPEAIDAIRRGEWTTWKPMWMAGQDVHGSTVGIVGLGRIGRAVARRLRGFNCRILYHDVRPRPEVADELGATYVDMDTLLAECDFITLHPRLNASTYHLFDAEKFRKMKKTAILINTSRGPVVDQEALYQALVNGEILAAGLDVTEPEPLPVDHPLLQLPNCVVLPHIASASVATRTKMALIAAENLIAGVQGKPLPYPVEDES